MQTLENVKDFVREFFIEAYAIIQNTKADILVSG